MTNVKDRQNEMIQARIAAYARRIAEIAAEQEKTFAELEALYHQAGIEDFAADDAYVEWLWLRQAMATLQAGEKSHP